MERGVLQQFCADLRSGTSRVLVLRGAAGVGKTALIDAMLDSRLDSRLDDVPRVRVVRVAGAEADMDLTFAAVQQVCAPLMDHLQRLPALQQHALTVAFGRGAGPRPDRFVVGLAVLELMAAAAGDGPVLCVIDDAHWVDPESLQTLAFVARRLPDAPLGLLFGVRSRTGRAAAETLSGLAELAVAPLSDSEAGELFDSVLPGRIDPRVRARIIAETRGNPRALHALPATFTAAEIAGGFTNPRIHPGTAPPGGLVANAGVPRNLPAATRRLLLTAAAEPAGDPLLLTRAADLLGLSLEDLAAAAGLVDVGSRVQFRDPYLRTLIYRSANLDERRRVHRALAEATDGTLDPARRAWHAANATTGPDEAVATQLQESAGYARDIGGVVAAAAFLERATALSTDPARRGARALAAAEAKHLAGEHSSASDLLGIAESSHLSTVEHAQARRLRILLAGRQIVTTAEPAREPAALLLDIARQLSTLDSRTACGIHLDALSAAMVTGRRGESHVLKEAAESARCAAGADPLLDGVATRIACGPQAIPELWRALQGVVVHPVSQRWPAFPMMYEAAALECWDDEVWHALATAVLRSVRDVGALAVLPDALGFRAGLHIQSGEFTAAAGLLDEAARTGLGAAPPPQSAVLAAWRGDTTETTRLVEAVTSDSHRGGRATGVTGYAAAVLDNGLGHYDRAFAAAQQACEYEDLGYFGGSLLELIEAGTRCGQRESASEALEMLEARTSTVATPWAAAALSGGRALLARGERADRLHRESIESYERTRLTVQVARARLRYGEWLRRANRRPDAVRQLRAAHEVFSRSGALGFAERARRELAAAGKKPRALSGRPGERLTAREAQIAGLAAHGLTNQEIGAQLYISTHTVEWHLRKVFSKLGITSRRQLRHHAAETTGFQGSDSWSGRRG
jgi:DNA-binding CsgD family transcriptional regulator